MTKNEVLELIDKMIEDRKALAEVYPDEKEYWLGLVESYEIAYDCVNLLEEK